MKEDSALKNIKYLQYFLLLFICGSLIYAASVNRPFFEEGILVFYQIINNKGFSFNELNYRWVILPMQLPLLISQYLSWVPYYSYAKIFSFSHVMHPIISLGFCFYLLQKRKRLDLFPFAVIGFCLGTMSLMAYSAVIVPETLSLYWPLFFLILLRTGSNSESLFIIVLSLFLMVSYEASLLFFILNILILTKNKKRNESKIYYLIILINILGAIFMAWRIKFAPKSSIDLWLSSFNWGDELIDDGYRFFGILSVIFLLYSLYTSNKRVLLSLNFILFLSYLFWFYYFGISEKVFSYIWQDRSTTIPLTSFICLMIFYYYKNSKINDLGKSLWVASCLFSIIALHQDLWLTKNWSDKYSKLQKLRDSLVGCNVISDKLMTQLYKDKRNFSNFAISYLSMGIEKSKKPNSFIFVEEYPSLKSCQLVNNQFLQSNSDPSNVFEFPSGSIDYHDIFDYPPNLLTEKMIADNLH